MRLCTWPSFRTTRLGSLPLNITYDINHRGSVRLAELARKAGVKRFVYMSSCSVYGVADSDYVDEESPVNPQTAYAICKTLVERDLKAMADDGFSPTFLRNATAYGASPRMRFDIVLNNLAGLAWTTRRIAMTSDGTPWRPLVHGLDIARAILEVLEAPREAVHNEVFNVGDTEHNYRVKEIAEIVAETFPGCEVSFGSPGADNRSYRVSFEKIRKHLPNFECAWDARRGARQLYDLFKRIDMTPGSLRLSGLYASQAARVSCSAPSRSTRNSSGNNELFRNPQSKRDRPRFMALTVPLFDDPTGNYEDARGAV